jgi:hypothetical protein
MDKFQKQEKWLIALCMLVAAIMLISFISRFFR